MRILQISSARHFGGGERHFVDLTNGLVERGHEIFIAAIPQSPILTELPSAITATAFELSASNIANAGKALALRRFVRDREIQIVHAHMARDYPLAALAVGRSGKPRLVITRHVLFPMSNLHRITRRRIARVIAVSQSVAASLKEQGIFREEQIAIVPNGIDLARFHVSSERNATGKLRVAILGELTPNKGQIEFVRAAQIVANEMPNVEFIIAGRDNSDNGAYARDLKQLIETTSLGDCIQLVEAKIDVAEFLSTVDLLVSASRSEAFGLTIIEAMAAGVPVVATATGGASEIISEGKTGRLVDIDSVPELAAEILRLLQNPQERRNISDIARQMVAERFSVQRMVSETEVVYAQILEAHIGSLGGNS